jgi:hypothetical protein
MAKLKKWTLYDSFKSQSATLVPIFLSIFILIGLIAYELINRETLSEESKRNILYGELVLSFIASFPIIIFMTFMIIQLPFSGVFQYIVLLTTPFVLTLLRLYLQNEQSDKYLSVLTIISTLYSFMFTVGVAFGSLINKPWF